MPSATKRPKSPYPSQPRDPKDHGAEAQFKAVPQTRRESRRRHGRSLEGCAGPECRFLVGLSKPALSFCLSIRMFWDALDCYYDDHDHDHDHDHHYHCHYHYHCHCHCHCHCRCHDSQCHCQRHCHCHYHYPTMTTTTTTTIAITSIDLHWAKLG